LPASSPTTLVIESVEFFMRNRFLRMPFRYGKACLTAAPLLHTRLRARAEDGTQAEGVSADMLPPKWFDKDPAKNFERNVTDLIAVAKLGAKQYLETASNLGTPFAIWKEASSAIADQAGAEGFNGLTARFGSSIIERAMLDAAGKLSGCDFYTMAHENRLGIEPGAVHRELDGVQVAASFPAAADSLYVRHTIGFGDPIREADILPADRLRDGIPQSVEAWIRQAGVRYFKIKIGGDLDADCERLVSIAALLDDACPETYGVSLDGNELLASGEVLSSWYEAVREQDGLGRFLDRVLYIEQPIERSAALRTPLGEMTSAMPPIIIDESDDHLDAFKQSVTLGYRGTSVKNCKGVFSGLLNKMLVDTYNDAGTPCILTGEDLSNQPIVPLQQDLCALSVLGLEHAERNGHHYGGALNHLSARELADCLRVHPGLYEKHGASARLVVRDGQIDLRSLRQAGFGVGIATDFDSMTPTDDWEYASLGVTGA